MPMSSVDIDLRPVSHILADSIGPPGKRVFYLQGWQNDQTVTLIVEKFQIQSLAIGLEQFLAEIQQKYPELSEASADYQEDKMHINPPVDPLFRVGELGLGYDPDSDLIILVARETVAEGEEPESAGVVRFWCSRSQLRALSHWGIEMASRGRPLCPQCGEPMDPEGHFCAKKNGHLH
jgi:uncharacterized repeat protein (TIGR03847 family)